MGWLVEALGGRTMSAGLVLGAGEGLGVFAAFAGTFVEELGERGDLGRCVVSLAFCNPTTFGLLGVLLIFWMSWRNAPSESPPGA